MNIIKTTGSEPTMILEGYEIKGLIYVGWLAWGGGGGGGGLGLGLRLGLGLVYQLCLDLNPNYVRDPMVWQIWFPDPMFRRPHPCLYVWFLILQKLCYY